MGSGPFRVHPLRPATAGVLMAVVLLTPTAAGSTSAAPTTTSGNDGAPAVPLSSCWSSDAGMPTWGEPVFSPAVVDVSQGAQDVTVALPVTDHGSPGPATGVARVLIDFLGEVVDLQPTTGDIWQTTVRVYPKTSAGTHTIRSVTATDRVGNERGSSEDGTPHPELGAGLTVLSTPLPTPPPEPVVTSLTVSKQKVDVRKKARKVRFRMSVDESQVAVERAHLRFNSYPFRDVVLTRTGNGFTGTAKVTRSWRGRHKARVASLTIRDTNGNLHRMHTKELNSRFGLRPVTVVARKDPRPPRAVKTRIRPKIIDARRATQKVTVTVHARDRHSGVRFVFVSIGEDIPVTMKRVRGTARDGRWRGRVTLDRCDVPSELGWVWVHLGDRANGWTSVVGARFKSTTNDLVRPRAVVLHPDDGRWGWPVDPTVRVRFTERVTGVNETSFRVVRRDDDLWSDPLAADLTCFGPAGAVVSCGSQRVKEVHWIPEPGQLGPGQQAAVSVNPDGVLDIRDRAGNPLRREEIWFGVRAAE